MRSIEAFEGTGFNLHRNEDSALAEIIMDAGEDILCAVISSTDAKYQKKVADAILRAAELIKRNRKRK